MDKFLKWLILLLIVLMIIILFYENVMAEPNISGSVSIYKTIPSDSENIVQSGHGFQTNLHYKNIYLYASKDKNPIRFAGQSGIDLDLFSVGVGIQYKLGKHLTLACDAGWYEPKNSKLGKPQTYPDSPFAEGLCRYLNEFLLPDDSFPAWDYYTYNVHGAIGGKLKLEFEYPITEKISFEMITGYRYLKLLENVEGRDWSNGNDWEATNYWTVRYDRDFSAWMIGGMIVVKL